MPKEPWVPIPMGMHIKEDITIYHPHRQTFPKRASTIVTNFTPQPSREQHSRRYITSLNDTTL
nr:hypothetical protein [Allomuricauda sp.]